MGLAPLIATTTATTYPAPRHRPFRNPLALLRPPETIASRLTAIGLLAGVVALFVGAAL